MSAIRTFLCRLAGLFGKQRKDLELGEELESHLQLQIEDNIRSGMTLEQARRDALIKSGGLESAMEASVTAAAFRHWKLHCEISATLCRYSAAVRHSQPSP